MNVAERRWRRLKMDTPVVLHKWDGAKESDVMTRSYELSEGGMAVSVPDSLEVGAPVVVSFSLPMEANALRMRAIVRNQRGARCGLEFTDLRESERDELARYLGAMTGAAES